MIVAGVDSSTQSCTVGLYDVDSGRLLASGQAPHPPTVPPVSEQDPADWWNAFAAALQQACHDSEVSPREIAGISFAAQYSGLVVLDDHDRVLHPAKLWNDTTSAADAAQLVANLDASVWIDEIGCEPTAAQTVAKIAALQREEPSDYTRALRFCSPADWLTMQLTGAFVTDPANASGTGLFNLASRQWSPRLLAAVDAMRDWGSSLPRILAPGEAAGFANTTAAAALGLSPQTMVAAGTGDQAAAALALGIEVGDVVVSLGTSGTVYGYATDPPADHRRALTITANALGGFLPIAVLLNAAKVTDAFARLLGVSHDEFAALALSADTSDPERPVLAAFLDGERSPNLPHARGLLGGIDSAVTREQLALCAVEGVALGLFHGFTALQDAGVENSGRLFVTGGASKSHAYQRTIARFFGRDVWMPEKMPGSDSARGAAIQAATAVSGRDLAEVLTDWRPESRLVARVPESPHAADNVVRERYDALAAFRGADLQSKTLP